jgi:hypothetical protein
MSIFYSKGINLMKNKFSIAMSLAVIMAMLLTSLALADQVVNNIDNTIDSALETKIISSGGSTVVGFYIQPSNTIPSGDASGCNATGAEPATAAISVPAGVTASTSSVTFIGCGDTPSTVQSVTFSSSSPGSYTVSISGMSGGKAGSLWNTAPASFTLVVNPPADSTPPVLHLPANIITEATGPSGAVVTFTATADDANPAHPAVTCSTVSGSTFSLGTTTVTCSATDAAGNTASGSFTVTVRDTTAPSLAGMPTDITVEGNTTSGANVPFTPPTATDIVDASPSVNCSADSGDFFPLGTTTVTCTATDASGNSSNGSFKVTVVDTIAPSLVGMPSDMTVEGNTTGGANVSFTAPTATDIVDASPSVNCSADSGDFFALGGPYTVTCTATDDSGNSSSDSFDVTVVDTTAPVLADMPSDMTVEGNTIGGADVSFTDPTATDVVDASPSVNCSPASGSFFALGGPHAVTCTATDASGNSSSDSFDVTVVDTTAPNIADNPDMEVAATGPSGAVVTFSNPAASDIVDASVDVVCSPASGSTFAPGHTTVTCTATDDSGNSASSSFDVWVKFQLLGFYQPVDMGKLNIAKNGSTVPLKFEVFAGSTELTNTSIVSTFVQKLTCGTGVATDDIENYATGGTSLRYDTVGGQFIFNWQTPKLAGNCYRVILTTADGSSIYADFKLK